MIAMVFAATVLSLASVAPPAAEPPSNPERMIERTYDPGTREQAVQDLQRWLDDHPGDRRARRALAQALAWSGRHEEALEHYGILLDDASAAEAHDLQIERLQVLAWKGDLRAAAKGYRVLLDQNPADVDARLGLARVLRWRGRPLAARWHARRALKHTPQRADVRQELAWSYAMVGERAAAERALGEIEPSEQLRQQLNALARPAVGVMGTGSGNSFDIYRVASRARTRIPLPWDLGLEVGAGMTHLQQNQVQQTYGVAALAVTAAIDRVELRAGGGAYAATDYYAFDGHGQAIVHIVDELHLGVGYRHRPLLESALPGAIGEAAFHGAGVGSAQLLDEALAIETDQLEADLKILPASWAYLYGNGQYMWLDDDNRGFTVSTGLGANLLAYWSHWPVSLFARWDTYMAGFERMSTAYFAPGFLDVHSVGPELQVQAWKLDLRANGGATFPLIAQGAKGWFAGGAVLLGTERVSAGLRGDYRSDAFYQQWRAWLSLDIAL